MRPNILSQLAKQKYASEPTLKIESDPLLNEGPSGDYYGDTSPDFGNSKYDTQTSTALLTKQNELNYLRGERQSNWAKAGNGLVGMAGKTLTTATEGIINPFYGTVAAIANGNFNSYYNNDLTKQLDKINEAVDESNPFYSDKEESTDQGLAKLWHANTIFRDIMGGAGTSIGAAVTGAAWSKAFSVIGKALGATGTVAEAAAAIQEAKTMGASSDKLRTLANELTKKQIKDGARQGTIALMSATGESGAEARETEKNILYKLTHDVFGNEKNMSKGEMDYAIMMSKQAGDAAFGMNLPVIMADNWLTFGKVMFGNKTNDFAKIAGKGTFFDDATQTYKAVEKSKYANLGYRAGKLATPMLSEGNQEMLQFGIGKTAEDYYVNKYYNPNAANFLDSFTKGMTEAYTSQDGWHAGIIGALSAGITSPGIVLATQGPKGFKDEFMTNPDDKIVSEAVTSLNKYSAVDLRNKYVNNLIRSANLTENKDDALAANKDFDYHNANEDLMFSYVYNRLQNGKLDDTKKELDNFKDLTVEELRDNYGIEVNNKNKDQISSLTSSGAVRDYVQSRLKKISEVEETYNQVNKLFPDAHADVKELLTYSAQGLTNTKERKLSLSKDITKILQDNNEVFTQIGFAGALLNKDKDQSNALLYASMDPKTFGSSYNKLTNEQKVQFKKNITDAIEVDPLHKDEILGKLDDLESLHNREKDFVLSYNALKQPEHAEHFLKQSETLWSKYADIANRKENIDKNEESVKTESKPVEPVATQSTNNTEPFENNEEDNVSDAQDLSEFGLNEPTTETQLENQDVSSLLGDNDELNTLKDNTTLTNTDTDDVSERLISDTSATTNVGDQVTENPSEKQKGFFSDIAHGMSTMANVVMMKVFNNYVKEGSFIFERTNEGLPELNTESKVDIDELNSIKQGDTIEFELVTLEGKALEDYNKSKEESINHINHHITNMGNTFGYGTNDKTYGFNDKHIAIKSNGKIIGYVQQPHAISNTQLTERGKVNQKIIDARNEIIEQRKLILDDLSKGKVTSTIKIKGSGNLYTKLKSNGTIDTVNTLFNDIRKQDKATGGNLIFVFNNKGNLELPKMDDSNMELDIKVRLSELGNWGKSGSVYQLVKDTSSKWYPIPVYASLMNDISIKSVMETLKGLSSSSIASDIIKALNPFIYSTFDSNKKAPIIINDRNKNDVTLTIDNTTYGINDLNSGIGLSTFKKSLETKRQNVEILNINSSFTQDSIKKRDTLRSNAVKFQGEYLVQPFISYEPIGESKEVKDYNKKETSSEEKPIREELKAETALERRIRLKGNADDVRFSRTNFGDISVNRKNAKAWLADKLPGLTLSDINELSTLKTTLNDAIGAYRNMVIYLFNGATNKTHYHEAFHGVFRHILTTNEQFDLLEEAITKYTPPTEKDLDYLQEGLKDKHSPEQLTALYYEEKIADDFAEFANGKAVESTWTKIKNFFNKILSHFDIFTQYNQTNIDNLFDSIVKGKLAKRSTVNKKKNLDLVNKELRGETFGPIAYARHDKLNATVKWERTKSIGDTFKSKYQTLVMQGVKNIKFAPIYKEIFDQYKVLENNAEVIDNMSDRDFNLLTVILENTGTKEKPSYPNFEFLVKESVKYLESYNIKVDLTKGAIEYTEQLVTEEDVVDNEVSTMVSKETKGLSEQVSQAGLKSASVRLKMFVSSIPVTIEGVEQKDAYNFPMYHDFNKVYYFLERQLTGISTFQGMIDEMTKLSDVRPEISTIINKLTKPSTFTNSEELIKLQNDFKSNFDKQQLSYVLSKFNTDSSTGTVSYKTFDANRQSVINVVSDEWKNNLINPNKKTIAKEFEGELIINGTKESIRIAEQWMGLSKLVLKKTAKYEVVNKLLMKLGIEFTPDVLKTLLNGKGSSNLAINITDIITFHASSVPTKEQKEAYDKAFRSLIELETSGILLSYSQSFNNVENSNIYTIQLPSFASKLMSNLTGSMDKFKKEIANLQKDPMYKGDGTINQPSYNNIINELILDNDFRTTKFRLNYLDGLKDNKGTSDGAKFTNMTSKDFMSLQISLFQNLYASSGGKIARAKTNKYIYITPADKSMAMIFDGKSYNAQLNDQGEIDINTPIVNNFYNVLLQEASRIKQQLEVKDKVLKDPKGKERLLEHYHYAKGSKPTDFNGFAYKIMHFGDTFNKKFNQMIIDNLSSSDNVRESLATIESLLKAEIVEQLKKDHHATIKEALNEGVVSGNEKGVLKSISIDNNINKNIRQVLADFSLNTWLNNIEMSTILNGDIAEYKAGDLQKRTYQSGAMGVSINNEKQPIARTKVVKDFNSKSELSSIEESMLSEGISEQNVNDILNPYGHTTKSQTLLLNDPNISEEVKKAINKLIKENNVTDAQVLVHPNFYKAIFEGRGTWTSALQTAFDIAEGIITNPTAKQLIEARLQLSNIKPFYFGKRFDDYLGIHRFEQVKCAMLPLFKSYNKTNPLMTAKRAEMDRDKLDMIAFESSFKAAIGHREDITSDKGVILDLDMNNFMIQVDNPAHMIDEENDSIRQIKMLILGNIDPNKTYSGKSGKTIIEEINDIEGFNIEESLKELNKLIHNKKDGKFKTFLKEMLTKRNATDNMMEALNVIGDDFEYALDNGSTSVAIENLISSLFTNKVLKQGFKGGSGVQASSLGMKYESFAEQQKAIDADPKLASLQTSLQYFKNKDGIIEWAEATMPAWSNEFFNEDGTHKDNIPDNLKELLFYRIPTEGFHSMMPIRVKSFLPVEYGNTILMPYEVTTQFGADFDFDKVYFIRPEFKTNEEGLLEKIVYDENKTIFENSKSARNNKILDNYLTVLSSKEILPLMMKPSGFEKIKNFKELIDKKDNIIPNKLSFFSSVTQRDYKNRNHTGIGLKSTFALHVSGHSYATLFDLVVKSVTIDKSNQALSGITFNKVHESSLSKQYGFNGDLISREVSSIMAAVLDDIKNPIIQAIGVNEFTADVWATIVRAGFDVETAINFTTQPSIVELSKKLAENNYKIKTKGVKRNSVDTLHLEYIHRLAEIEKLLNKEESKEVEEVFNSIGNNNLNDVDLEFYRNWKAVNVNKLHPNADSRNPKQNLELAKYYAFQLNVLNNYENFDKVAKGLVKINRLFSMNKQVGPNMEDMINKKYLMDEIEENSFPIGGIDSGNLNTIKSLDQAYKTNTSALDFLSRYFPYDSSTYNNVKTSFINGNIKHNGGKESLSKIEVKKRMLMNGFIRNFIDYKSNVFKSLNSSDVKKDLFKRVPNLINEIQDSNNDEKFFNGALRKNVFIDNIKATLDEKSGLGFINIKGNRLDTQLKNNISESIYSLHKNPSTAYIIKDLVDYSFVATGFHRGLKSFHDLIPPIVLKELGYSDYRKIMSISLNLNTYKFDDSQTKRLINQMVRNFPSEFTKSFDISMFEKKDQTLVTNVELSKLSGRQKEVIINFDQIALGEFPVYVEYLRVYDDFAKKVTLYQHVKAGKYKAISLLGKAGNMIEINALEDIEFSINKENNLDNKAIVNTLADETSTDQEIESPILNSEIQDINDFFNIMSEEEINDMQEKEELDREGEELRPDPTIKPEDWTSDTNECGI